MSLFTDITDSYVKTGLAGADSRDHLRLTKQELTQLHATGLAVADTETTGLKAGVNGLTELAAVRAMTIGEIKAFNKKAEAKHLPPEQRIPEPQGLNDDAIRLISLQRFVLPNKPIIHDLEGEEDRLPAYNSGANSIFEYKIDPRALNVTGANIERKKGYGPIKNLIVGGEKRDAEKSFLPLMNAFLLFTTPDEQTAFKGTAYFNTPFDTPFLKSLIIDAMAYQEALHDRHLQEGHALSVRLKPDLAVEYDAPTTTPEQRSKIIAHIVKRMEDSGIAQERLSEYYEPANWYCILQAFRAAHPERGTHTLDAFMETMGISKGDRGDHSAIDDVMLSIRGMLKLQQEGHVSHSLPSMGELAGIVLSRTHDGAISIAAENGRNVAITLPKGTTEIAKAVERVLASYNEAKPADPMAPPLNAEPSVRRTFTTFERTDDGLQLTLSGEDKRPRFLSLLKNVTTAVDILTRYNWITDLQVHDRPGTFVDVTISGTKVQDVPWNILRRKVDYLQKQPASERAELLSFLRDIEAKDPSIGGVMLVDRGGKRCISMYGHVRSFGTVDVPWPQDMPLSAARETLFKQLDKITGLGIIPFGVRGEMPQTTADAEPETVGSEAEDDPKRKAAAGEYFTTTLDVMGKNNRYHLEIDPRLFQLFKASLPIGFRDNTDLDRRIPVKVEGDKIEYISVIKQKDKVILEGSPAAFDSYIAEPQQGKEAPVAIAEKPTNILRDAGWLLYRMEQIPGTSSVEVTADNRIRVHQALGISIPTLALLHQVKIPHRASAEEVHFSAGALMQNAFHWSLGLARAQQEENYRGLTEETSIVPSLVKGLLDPARKDENQKKLDHVMYHPYLGLQLHYSERGSANEVIQIPHDRLVARTLPVGRRRVQRVFARLKYLPKEIAHKGAEETVWEVQLTPLERTLFEAVLGSDLKPDDYRMAADGGSIFTISESALAKKKNLVFQALLTMSDQLAAIGERTQVPEWQFAPYPELGDENKLVMLRMPLRDLFTNSASGTYEDTQRFLEHMQRWHMGAKAPEKSLSQRIRNIVGGRDGVNASALANLGFELRRKPNASVDLLISAVEREMPNIRDVHAHCRDLASRIATENDIEEDASVSSKELALAYALKHDRVWVAHIIAASDAMMEKDAEHAEYWTALRNKAILAEDKMAEAIHGSARLKEALNTAAHTVMNGGSSWKKSVLGAMIHAKLDRLDQGYVDAIKQGQPNLVERRIREQRELLDNYGVLLDKKTKGERKKFFKDYEDAELNDGENEERSGRRFHIDDYDMSDRFTGFITLKDGAKPIEEEIEDADQFPASIKQYQETAALRLLVRFGSTQNKDERKLLERAAKAAVKDVWGEDFVANDALFDFLHEAADPKSSLQQCQKLSQVFLNSHAFPPKTKSNQREATREEIVTLILLAFGKISPDDLDKKYKASVEEEIEATLRNAKYKLGQAHLYVAAKLSAETARMDVTDTSSDAVAERLAELQAQQETHLEEGRKYYKHDADAFFKRIKRDAIKSSAAFEKRYKPHEQLLALQTMRDELINYTPAMQANILKACIALPDGEEELRDFLLEKLPSKDHILAKAQSICTQHPNFDTYRDVQHKRALLKAKDRMFEELDDLKKIESHVRRRLDALMAFLHDTAVEHESLLAATPLHGESLHRPERFGLDKDIIGELRQGVETLDRKSLEQAKASLFGQAELNAEEWAHRTLQVPLDILLMPHQPVTGLATDSSVGEAEETPSQPKTVVQKSRRLAPQRLRNSLVGAVQEFLGMTAVTSVEAFNTYPGRLEVTVELPITAKERQRQWKSISDTFAPLGLELAKHQTAEVQSIIATEGSSGEHTQYTFAFKFERSMLRSPRALPRAVAGEALLNELENYMRTQGASGISPQAILAAMKKPFSSRDGV